ncbi:MFS transporter [Georgenia sp. SUBG003]|uniref:MFS transporter n=1 Tax=Georgenia sp. SUBG003 TaxID=1497974 RepID=UPI000A6BE6EF
MAAPDAAPGRIPAADDGPAGAALQHAPPSTRGLTAIWGPALRTRTTGLWLVWFLLNFAYYGAFTWLPTLLVASGLDLVRSFEYTLIITAAQLPGYAAAAYLIERWGRRPTLASFLLGAAAASYLFAVATTPAAVVTAGCLLSFFALGAWGRAVRGHARDVPRRRCAAAVPAGPPASVASPPSSPRWPCRCSTGRATSGSSSPPLRRPS